MEPDFRLDPRLEAAIAELDAAEKRLAIEKARDEIKQDYLVTFTSPAGARVLADLCRAFVEVDLHVPGDPYGTHVAVGQRNAIMRIVKIVQDQQRRS